MEIRITYDTDVALCFVPQWSPFQPPLSIPSLAAWMRRAHFLVDVIDANISFYHFLLGAKARDILLSESEFDRSSKRDSPERRAAVAGISSNLDFRQDIDNLLRWNGASFDNLLESRDEVLIDTYRATNSLDTYLRFVSILSPQFSISPYEFHLKPHSLSVPRISDFVDDPPELLREYVSQITVRILSKKPKVVGLSCIGQEQVLFSLMIGGSIKAHSNIPVIIGGTVFSRIAERGVLPNKWFRKYFDVIVKNEGERPLENLLHKLESYPACLDDVPGIVFLNKSDEIVSTKTNPPLSPSDIPTPDFSDLPLGSYITSKITLPLLSSRGCYWGKCEFCHHGMVYGEKYSGYKNHDVVQTILSLKDRYSVNYFALNDEAIPPSMLRKLGSEPELTVSDIFFTGLIKFEKYFKDSDFIDAYRAGFRALYVGLESASERVLELMRKNTSREVMERNLRDATGAGIWMHCFVFFGFPGERDEDATDTIEFITGFKEHIGSYGAGVFSLEHNAPIMRRLDEHGLKLRQHDRDEIDVYFEYENDFGISHERALEYLDCLNEKSSAIKKYTAVNWIPREQLLILLSIFSHEELVASCIDIQELNDVFPTLRIRDHLTLYRDPVQSILINRFNRVVIGLGGASKDVVHFGFEENVEMKDILSIIPSLGGILISQSTDRLSMHETSKVI